MLSLLASLLIFTEDGNQYEANDKKVLILVQEDTVSIDISESVEEIKAGSKPSSAFDLCRNKIKSVTFKPNSALKKFGESLLAGTVVETVDFSNCPNLLQIPSGCCHDCHFLTKFILPPNVKVIGAGMVFSRSLESLEIPDSVEQINDWATNYGGAISCSNLKTLTIGKNSLLNYVGNHGFIDSGIEKFFIPKPLVYFGLAPFLSCKISQFTVDSENPSFSTDGVTVYNKEGNKIMFIANILTTETYTIRNNVNEINGQAFRGTYIKKILYENPSFVIPASGFQYSGIEELSFPSETTYVNAYLLTYSSTSRVILHDKITSIGGGAFSSCTNLREVVMSNKMQTIGYGAFTGDVSLKSIYIPNTVTDIGYGSFSGCGSPFDINFQEGNSRYYFENGILYYNNKFVDYIRDSDEYDVIIPNYIDIILESMFMYKKLNSITFQEVSTTTKISYRAFYGSSVRTVVLPPSVTIIYHECFGECKRLETFTIAGNLETIEYSAFKNCINLRRVDIQSNSLNTINTNTFFNCISLEEFTFEKLPNLARICEESFYNTGLKTLNLPGSLKVLEPKAFSNSAIVTLTFDPSITFDIPSYCFSNCTSLTEITFSPLTKNINTFAFSNCTSLIKVALGKGIEIISQYAFAYSTNINVVSIPQGSSLKYIMGYAFKETNLNHFEIADEKDFKFEDGLLMSGNKTNLIYFISNVDAISIVLPSTITIIGDYAFQNAIYLLEVIIPNGNNFEKIGFSSFEGCTALRRIILPKTLQKIEQFAFKDCNKILCGGLYMNVSLIDQARKAGIPERALSEGCINNLRAMLKIRTCKNTFMPLSLRNILSLCYCLIIN